MRKSWWMTFMCNVWEEHDTYKSFGTPVSQKLFLIMKKNFKHHHVWLLITARAQFIVICWIETLWTKVCTSFQYQVKEQHHTLLSFSLLTSAVLCFTAIPQCCVCESPTQLPSPTVWLHWFRKHYSAKNIENTRSYWRRRLLCVIINQQATCAG